MRYKLTVEYNGKDYHGWQVQKNAITVQEVLESALCKIGIKTTTVASGRTDSGVHAAGQVVHFDSDVKIPCDRLPLAINAYLPLDVAVVKCEIVSGDFNARFSAKKKTYCYRFYVSRLRHPLLEINHYQVTKSLDLAEMRAAANEIEGKHDFKCFEAVGSKVVDTVRTVYEIRFETKDLIGGREIEIYVTGNGFLYNMVRAITGTVLYAAEGKLMPEDIPEILNSGNRTLAGPTAPPGGLYLTRVWYEDERLNG